MKQKMLSCVDAAFNCGAHTTCDHFKKHLSDGALVFLRLLNDLKEVTEFRILMTAPKEMAKEKALHKMWTVNEWAKKQVADVKNQLTEAEKELQVTEYELEDRHQTLRDQIHEMNEESADKISNEMLVRLWHFYRDRLSFVFLLQSHFKFAHE